MKNSNSLEKTAKGRRPVYLDGCSNDKIFRMLLVTLQELSVTRDRLAALETVLEQADLPGKEAVDNFKPDEAWDDARSAKRDELTERVFRDLKNSLG